MNIAFEKIRSQLTEKKLKVTPQRLAILEAVHVLGNHPTAENVTEYVRKNQPNIASGTVYSVLETMVKYELIKKVTTDRDVMRYDAVMQDHHHLYCTECDLIEDYMDEELNELLRNYLKERNKGFSDQRICIADKRNF
ncbi:MAG: transcriptional repressor [Bacteroidales bacterium]|nr:transcriptional repressor [Bacteroidales bacterium]